MATSNSSNVRAIGASSNTNQRTADRYLNFGVRNASDQSISLGQGMRLFLDKGLDSKVIELLDGPSGEGLNTSPNYDPAYAEAAMAKLVARMTVDYRDAAPVEQDIPFGEVVPVSEA